MDVATLFALWIGLNLAIAAFATGRFLLMRRGA
jgi:hypothetical protein